MTIVRRGRSNITGDTTDLSRTLVPGCFVQPTSTSEVSGRTGGAAQATQRARVYGPEALRAARVDDVIETPGWQFGVEGTARLQVQGAPMVWPNVKGQIDHVELDLQLVTG